MNERTHFLIKKYTSHTLFSKRLMLVVGERWVGDGNRLLHIDPKFFWPWQHFFLLRAGLGCSTVGHWGPKPSVCRWLSLRHLVPNWLQLELELELELTQTVCGTWLYNYFTSTCFLWADESALNSTTSTGQGDIPISSTGCTCLAVLLLIYTSASLDWRLGQESIWYTTFTKYILRSAKVVNWSFFSKNEQLRYSKNGSYPWKTEFIFRISSIKLAQKRLLFLGTKKSCWLVLWLGTWNHIIAWKCFVLDRNTWNDITSARCVLVTVVGNKHEDSSSKTWTRMFAYHIALIPPGKLYIQIFSPHPQTPTISKSLARLDALILVWQQV